MNINTITPDEAVFLNPLKNVASLPKSLYFIGKLPAAPVPAIAIIGTRKPTPYGQEVTYRLAYDLAKAGIVIISGLAIGVDAIAHQAALDAGGTTIGVLAGGLDKIHPSSNRALGLNIVQNGGALLSEYEPGTPCYKWNFVKRNRIESALSQGVLVVEAAAKSGTMQTSQFARKQGRAVMAVPGPITSPMSEGANNLLKSGALPITSADDIFAVLQIKAANQQIALPFGQNAQSELLQLLGSGAKTTDELQLQCTLSPAALSQELTLLELGGQIQAQGGRWIRAR